MRTLILVISTVFVLSLGYLGYWWMQDPGKVRIKPGVGLSQGSMNLKPRETDKPYGPGKGVWVTRYDQETAALVSRFKSDEYQPRNDGWVTVKNPKAQFFMGGKDGKDGRVISVEGETGEIIIDDPGNKKGMSALAGSRDTPSRGRLYGVTIKLYDRLEKPEIDLDTPAADKKISLTITLNNASFDNQTFKIYSEAHKDKVTGNKVDADQVRVEMRGRDYDFDGRGLEIRWNERDRRLQRLVIAHGERLVIKRPSNVLKNDNPAAAHFEGVPFDFSDPLAPLPLMLAARDAGLALALADPQIPAAIEPAPPAPATAPAGRTGRRPRAAAPVPKPKIKPNTDPPLYRATFHDNVKVVQAPDLDIAAQKMAIDFLMEDQDDSDESPDGAKPTARSPKRAATRAAAAATQPTTQPAPIVAAAPATAPSTQATTPSRRPAKRIALEAATRRAATQPTTQLVRRAPKIEDEDDADEVPITITWTGPLIVEPLSLGAEAPLQPGESIVKLEGTPKAQVIAKQQGSTIICGTLSYRTADQAMTLLPQSADRPVIMKDARGTFVQTTRMDYSQPKRTAILHGASNAIFPQEDEAGKKIDPVTAKWNKLCTLYFAPASKTDNPAGPQQGPGDMNIERAELSGDVAVDRPGQLKLRSQELELAFENTIKVTDKSDKTPTALKPGQATVAQATDAPSRKNGGVAQALPTPAQQAKLTLAKESHTRAQSTLAEIDAQLAQLNKEIGTADLSALVETKATELAKLEETLALKGRAMKDLQIAGAAIPKHISEEHAGLKSQYDTTRNEFDGVQSRQIRAQELKTERAKASAKLAEAKTQLEAAGAPALAAAVPAAARQGPATRPAIKSDLRQLIATGNVHCELTDSAKKTQFIDCNRLMLQTAKTPAGQIYASTINADGNVHAVDPEQDLRAGHLAVVLKPSTRPSKPGTDSATAAADLQSLIAHKDVKVITKDGVTATADQLLIDNKDGKNNLKLLGQPEAKVIDKKNTLTGPIIEIYPDTQRLEVVGRGTMKGMQQVDAPSAASGLPASGLPASAGSIPTTKPTTQPTERPIDVAWERGLSVDGKGNTIDVVGSVVAITTDADGATNTAKGNRVRMYLTDAPTTRPTEKPNPEVNPAIANAKPEPRKFGGMNDKTIRQITFEEQAEVSTVTLAPDGAILRRVHLQSQTIQYDLAGKKLNIPVAGKMVVEDHRPNAAPNAGAVANVEGNPAPGNDSRGSTAFSWPKTFTYDDTTKLAIMEATDAEQVLIVHQDDKDPKKVFKLTANHVKAELAEMQGAAKKPGESKVQMKRVTARGRLFFTGQGVEITAEEMEFDPQTNWLVARGNGREGVEHFDKIQGGKQTADEVWYNTQTGLVKAIGTRVRIPR